MSELKTLTTELYKNFNSEMSVDELIDTYWAVDFKEHETIPGVEVESDRDLARMMIGMMRGAMPDIHVNVDDLLQEDNKIVARGTFVGTHTGGEFMGKPADGRTISMPFIDILQWRGDKVTEHWGQSDMSGLMG
tara:strand:- start:58 stop:459 length:402 start_codon:yes stop_codon:yes gene_type:complete